MNEFIQKLLLGNVSVKELASRMLPGARVDENLARGTAIFGAPGKQFRILAESTISSPCALAMGIRLRELNPDLAERYNITYAVVINEGSIGEATGQFLGEDAPCAAIHELVERGVVTHFTGLEEVSRLAVGISKRINSAPELSAETVNRFKPQHLTAVGAEYISAYYFYSQTEREQKQRMMQVAKFHGRTVGAVIQHAGGISADALVRRLMFKNLYREGVFNIVT